MSNKFKKALAIGIMGIMLLSLAACGGNSGSGGSSDADADSDGDGEAPHYVAVTEATFPPFDTVDDDGNIVGFDMDLLNAIAEDQGFTVEYVDIEFDSLIPAVETKQYDIIAAGMNAEDPERQEHVSFSTTYYDSALVVLVTEDNDAVGSIDDLTAEMKVASQIGTTGADEVNALYDDGQIKEAVINNGFDTCMLQLKNGDVDAVIIDKPVAQAYINKQGGIKMVGEPLNAEAYGFAVSKDNTELLAQINAGLKNVTDNGTYDELVEKWFN